MRLPYWLLVAAALGGCSQTGQTNMQGDMQASFSADASQLDPSALAGQSAESDPVAPPAFSLGSLFAPARPAETRQTVADIPGDFTAPEDPPLPPSRPDFGDRQPAAAAQVAAAATAAPRAPETAPEAGMAARAPSPLAARAEGASLGAYEFKTAGAPLPNGGLRAIAFAPAQLELAAPAARVEVATGGRRWRAAYDDVQTSCFPETLRHALDRLAAHFNSEVLVTSGKRDSGRRGSMHRACKAADVRIAGVSPGEVARVAKTIPGINGVGTYRRVAVTHIDVRAERFAWHR